MAINVLMIVGSPLKNGNTFLLAEAFMQGVSSRGATIEEVHVSNLSFKVSGCTSCRQCQRNTEYGCIINDDASAVVKRMIGAHVIVIATPLYFFSASAQVKVIVDRMFSLYKWDNESNTMETVLKGKTLVLLASAFENAGLTMLEGPFRQTADYSGMKFESLLVPDAGTSGQIFKNNPLARSQAFRLGESLGRLGFQK
ncbi:MAG TPA: flavodoxin family protein [Candidatus Omnitrophota bacterium]|nr:flavodoxin family protein [Candidatus Omnitrophota bacterium]HPT07709.1 flavodoxin family protein [Candidatus Omnitrophota bacterium]